jgi:DNA-binding MarR family transcriptional regulator
MSAWRAVLIIALAVALLVPLASAGPDTIVWEGNVSVDEPFHTGPNQTLRVEPGTNVAGPAGVHVAGDVILAGAGQARVVWDTPLVVDGTDDSRTVVENATFPGRWGNVSDPLCTVHLADTEALVRDSVFTNHSTALCAGSGTDLVFQDNLVRHNGFDVRQEEHRPQRAGEGECAKEDCAAQQEAVAPWGEPGEEGACWPLRGELVACRGWGGRPAVDLAYESTGRLEGNRFVENHVAIQTDSADATIRANTFADNDAGVSVQANRWEVERIEREVTGASEPVEPRLRIEDNAFVGHGDPEEGDWPAIPVGSAITLFLGGATGPPPAPDQTRPDPANATVHVVSNTLREGGVGLEIQGWYVTALARNNTFLDNGVGVRGHSASAYLLDNAFHGHEWDLYADGYTGWLTATGGNLHEGKVHVAGDATVQTDWGLIGAGAGVSLLALLAFLTEQGRYWLVRLAWMPLYSRIERSDLLDHELRREIKTAVEETPGLHMRELARRSEASYGTVVYHLRRLESAGLIRSERDGIKRRFYPADEPVNKGEPPTRERVLAAVRAEPGVHQSAIASELGVSRQLVSYHLDELEEDGKVDRRSSGSRKRVFPSSAEEDPG